MLPLSGESGCLEWRFLRKRKSPISSASGRKLILAIVLLMHVGLGLLNRIRMGMDYSGITIPIEPIEYRFYCLELMYPQQCKFCIVAITHHVLDLLIYL